MGEFELIDRWFRPLGGSREDVALGIGDDAALLQPAPGSQLVATIDTLVEGRHFLPGAEAQSLGHRALAVSLSDLAAMGATPAWALLCLTLPENDAAWLENFAQGFAALAREHGVALVGGNTTRGPLNISVQMLGSVPVGAALRRSGAAAGDALYVTGTPGDAAAGRQAGCAAPALQRRFEYPTPRVAAGLALRGIASACIDVSDGLAADAHKLAAASGLRARLDPALLPLSPSLLAFAERKEATRLALEGGEDYELCFTVPHAREAALAAALPGLCRITQIGSVEAGSPRDALAAPGFDHFRATTAAR